MAIEITEDDSITYITLIHEFSVNSMQDIDSIWSRAKRNKGVVAFDCSELTFLDSTGIGTLIKFINDSQKSGIEMVIINVNPSLVKLFETAKLKRVLNILNSEEFTHRYVDNVIK